MRAARDASVPDALEVASAALDRAADRGAGVDAQQAGVAEVARVLAALVRREAGADDGGGCDGDSRDAWRCGRAH